MRYFTLLCFFVFQGNTCLQAEELPEEQKTAVVIGNYKYVGHLKSDDYDKKFKGDECNPNYMYERYEKKQSIEYSDIPNVLNDACYMAKKLRQLGFKVQLLLNANRDEMYAAIYYLFEKKNQKAKKNINLLYFSGHGTDQGKEYYLMSSTSETMCNGNLCSEIAITQNYVYDVIQKMMETPKLHKKSENTNIEFINKGNIEGVYIDKELIKKEYINFVILDACRSSSKISNQNSVLKKRQPPDYTFFAFATALNELSSGGNTETVNSRYTEQLLKFISKPGLPATEMFVQVNRAVEKETKFRNEKAKKNKKKNFAKCEIQCENDKQVNVVFNKNCKRYNIEKKECIQKLLKACKKSSSDTCESAYSIPEIQKPHFIIGEMKDETNFVFKEELIDQVPHW